MSTPTSQQYFKTFFPHLNLNWKFIYLLSRILTKDTSLKAFFFYLRFLSRTFTIQKLYLNHKLFQFKFGTNSLCSYCNKHDEAVQHLFKTYNKVILLWTEIKLYFVNDIKLIAYVHRLPFWVIQILMAVAT